MTEVRFPTKASLKEETPEQLRERLQRIREQRFGAGRQARSQAKGERVQKARKAKQEKVRQEINLDDLPIV